MGQKGADVVSGIAKVVDSLQSGLPEDISRYFGMLSKKEKKRQKENHKRTHSHKKVLETKQTSTDIVRSVMGGAGSQRAKVAPKYQPVRRQKGYKQQTVNKSPHSRSTQQTKRVSYHTAEDIKRHAISDYTGPVCPYCQSRAAIKTAKEHTGRDESYCYWVCPKCPNVSVTTYGKTYHPAGVLADAQTRRFRSEVQRLIQFKKNEFGNDRFKLNEWIEETINVESERAWVGQLSKTQLHHLARSAQKEQFQKKYNHIFK